MAAPDPNANDLIMVNNGDFHDCDAKNDDDDSDDKDDNNNDDDDYDDFVNGNDDHT